MKPASDAVAAALAHAELAAKRARWKRNAWCRQWDGDCDRPILRVVAAKLAMPLYQVIAFVRRLDSLANRTEPRGSVADFNAAEFGAALGMPEEDAARIFAMLGAPEIGWIVYGHVADFYDRNRDSDSDKEDAKERKRRSRGRKDGLEIAARLAARGQVTFEQRADIERELHLPPRVFPNEDFFKLLDELQRAELSTGRGHRWSQCDRVTVTQERSIARPEQNLPSVENSGTGADGATEALSDEAFAAPADDPQAAARLWMSIEGRRIAIARMPGEQPGRVDTLLERWRDQDLDGDAVGLMTVILQCDALNHAGSAFHVEMTQACARYRRQKLAREETQAQLPLRHLAPLKRGGRDG